VTSPEVSNLTLMPMTASSGVMEQLVSRDANPLCRRRQVDALHVVAWLKMRP
jgi:hypothetical protein